VVYIFLGKIVTFLFSIQVFIKKGFICKKEVVLGVRRIK